MTDQRESNIVTAAGAPAPSPVQAVTRRLDARRGPLPAALNEAPAGPLCDGWGLVPVLGLDGEYEPSACHGCALCAVVTPPVPGQAMGRLLADLPDDLGNADGDW